MFSKKSLFTLIALAAFAQAQDSENLLEEELELIDEAPLEEEPIEGEDEDAFVPFTVPQDCFASGKMVSARNARNNVADETNAEELYTEVFDHTMRISKITVCKDNWKRLTGAFFDLTSSPPQDIENDIEQKTLVLAPIGKTDSVECDSEEIGADKVIRQMKISKNAYVHGLRFSFDDGSTRLFGDERWNDRADTWDFDESNVLVGLTGQLVSNRLSKVGTVTVNPSCGAEAYSSWYEIAYPPEPEKPVEPEPQPTDPQVEEEKTGMEEESPVMMIAAVAVVAVILMAVVATTVLCCRRRMKYRNQMVQVANSSVASVTDDSKRGIAGPTQRSDLEIGTAKPQQTAILSEDETSAQPSGKGREHTEANLKTVDEKQVTIDN